MPRQTALSRLDVSQPVPVTGTLSDVSARGFYSPNNWVLLILLGVNVRVGGRTGAGNAGGGAD
jgi:hypothetical protein